MEHNQLILSAKDVNIQFNLRGKVLHAIRGIDLDPVSYTHLCGFPPFAAPAHKAAEGIHGNAAEVRLLPAQLYR